MLTFGPRESMRTAPRLPPDSESGRREQRPSGQHAREVTPIVRGTVQITWRVGSLVGAVRGCLQRVASGRGSSSGLLGGGRPDGDRAHVGEPDPGLGYRAI